MNHISNFLRKIGFLKYEKPTPSTIMDQWNKVAEEVSVGKPRLRVFLNKTKLSISEEPCGYIIEIPAEVQYLKEWIDSNVLNLLQDKLQGYCHYKNIQPKCTNTKSTEEWLKEIDGH